MYPLDPFVNSLGGTLRATKNSLACTTRLTIGFFNHEKATSYIPQAQFVAIENAAHLPQYENAEAVSSSILKFLGISGGSN